MKSPHFCTDPTKRFLCVKEVPDEPGDDPLTRRCVEQCWQCKHVEEFEALGEPPKDGEQ